MAEWIIRRAGLGDEAGLRQVITVAYAIYAESIADLPDVAGELKSDIANKLVFVAERDGEIGGGMVLVAEDGFLQLENIAVAPASGGQGLGRKLMERAEAKARGLGFHEMRLATHVLMESNVALYTHLGWQETERAGSKVLMRKQL